MNRPPAPLSDIAAERARIDDLIRRGQPEQALARCEQALTRAPRHAQLRLLRLRLLRRLGRGDAARAMIAETGPNAIRTDALPVFQRLAFDILLDAGDLVAARAKLAHLQGLEGSAGLSYLMCLARMQPAEAALARHLDRLEAGQAAHPGHAALAGRVADVMLEAGQADRAIAVLDRACAAHPDPELLARQARLLRDHQGIAAAAAFLDRVSLAAGQTRGVLILRLRFAQELPVSGTQADLARQALSGFPDDAELARLGLTLLARADPEAAGACAERLGRDAARPVAVRLAAAACLMAQQSSEAGLSLLRDLHAAQAAGSDGQAETARALARALMEHGFDPSAAIEVIEAADPAQQDVDLQQLCGIALARFGFLAEGVEVLQTLQEAGTLRRHGGFQLAQMHMRLGGFAQAEALLQTLDQPGARAQAALLQARGDLARAQFQLDQAAGQYRAAMTLSGQARSAGVALGVTELLRGQVEPARVALLEATADEGAPDAQALRRLRRSIPGQLLNEYRIFPPPPPGASPADCRSLLQKDPGSTPAAIATLTALRLSGALDGASLEPASAGGEEGIPLTLGQYWDAAQPPAQVAALMQWNRDMNRDAQVQVFNNLTAQNFLKDRGEMEVLKAYTLTRSAAAKADLFRLAWLWHQGGIWLDADDRCTRPLSGWLDLGLRFLGYQEHYGTLGNNFLAARAGDPILRAALDDACETLLAAPGASVWLSTGPGALTRAVARVGVDAGGRVRPGVSILPQHVLAQGVASHVRLNYKSTEAHWVQRMKRPGAG